MVKHLQMCLLVPVYLCVLVLVCVCVFERGGRGLGTVSVHCLLSGDYMLVYCFKLIN